MRKFILSIFAIVAINVSFAQNMKDIPVQAMSDFDMNRYAGTWYEVARLPLDFEDGCYKDIKINYTIKNEKTYEIDSQCSDDNNQMTQSQAIASVNTRDHTGQMKINFASKWVRWMGVGSKKYMVLDTDYTTFAVVGSPDREHAWVFSRTPKMRTEQVQQLVSYLQNNGYDVSSIIYNRTGMN